MVILSCIYCFNFAHYDQEYYYLVYHVLLPILVNILILGLADDVFYLAGVFFLSSTTCFYL